jgi:hypothetical protein
MFAKLVSRITEAFGPMGENRLLPDEGSTTLHYYETVRRSRHQLAIGVEFSEDESEVVNGAVEKLLVMPHDTVNTPDGRFHYQTPRRR